MANFLTQKNDKSFDIHSAVAEFTQGYYSHRAQMGKTDDAWQEILDQNYPNRDVANVDEDDLVEKFSQDIVRGYSTLTAGNVVAFTYTSLKGVTKSYFAVIVATARGNGQYGNIKTKNTLMTCFLVNSSTNLNTLGIVMDVIQSQKIKQRRKSYMGLVDEKKNRALRKATGVSIEGMAALFSKSEFRTFCTNVGMRSVYKVNLDG